MCATVAMQERSALNVTNYNIRVLTPRMMVTGSTSSADRAAIYETADTIT